MQNKILLIIVVILSFISLFISSSNTTFYNTKTNKINVLDSKTDELKELNLEEYVIGVVAAEMPASFNEEALKAQAIASRTYAVYKIKNSTKEYDVVTDVSDQSYLTILEMKEKWGNDFDKYYEKIKTAVKDTNNQIMLYDDEVICAYYFAMSNGYTEEVSYVFNENKDYLKSVEIKYDNEELNNFVVTKEFSREEICNLLDISCENLTFSHIIRSETGRVNTIKVNNKEFSGTEFRHKLSLRSTDFDIQEEENKIIITTKGYGHGVGMSQYGANGMANDGYTYDEILKYFYKNIEISSI